MHLPPCANKETIGIGKCLFLGLCLGIMEQTTDILLRELIKQSVVKDKFCCSVFVVAVVVCLFVSLFFVQ